ncbi:unnamed protein product [Calypogeia fissa]
MGSSFGNREDAAAAYVLAIPFPGQGHINPMLKFATQLAEKGIRVSLSATRTRFLTFIVLRELLMHHLHCKLPISGSSPCKRPSVHAIVNVLRSPFNSSQSWRS